jgi:molybdopterin synthase sulfur carrier subunit
MVHIAVPSILAAQAEGTRRFEVEAETVGDALHALPVDDLIFNERGELGRHLNVYIDGTDHRERGGLDASLEGAREIRVVAMVSGG